MNRKLTALCLGVLVAAGGLFGTAAAASATVEPPEVTQTTTETAPVPDPAPSEEAAEPAPVEAEAVEIASPENTLATEQPVAAPAPGPAAPEAKPVSAEPAPGPAAPAPLAAPEAKIAPVEGVVSLSYVNGKWTLILQSDAASEVKLIKPGQEVVCSEHDGKPKNGYPTCDGTTYTFVSQAECVMVQVDWVSGYNSSDPTECRTATPPVETPPFVPQDACAWWTVDNFPENQTDWPQTILSKDCAFVPQPKCEPYRIQYDEYTLRTQAAVDRYNAITVLNSSADDQEFEPHNYYVKTIDAKDCSPGPANPAGTVVTTCGSATVSLSNVGENIKTASYVIYVDGEPVDFPAVFAGETFTKDYTFAEDSGDRTVEVRTGPAHGDILIAEATTTSDCTVVVPPVEPPASVPATPTFADPCGPNNIVWFYTDTEEFTYHVNNSLVNGQSTIVAVNAKGEIVGEWSERNSGEDCPLPAPASAPQAPAEDELADTGYGVNNAIVFVVALMLLGMVLLVLNRKQARATN